VSEPRDFKIDKKKLTVFADEFRSKTEREEWNPHPGFGYFTQQQWGQMQYKHLYHHLRQLGVEKRNNWKILIVTVLIFQPLQSLLALIQFKTCRFHTRNDCSEGLNGFFKPFLVGNNSNTFYVSPIMEPCFKICPHRFGSIIQLVYLNK